MASFAKEANKAAKILGTTTTAYTDASLIYFQQGLSKKEVKEREYANVAQQVTALTTELQENIAKELDTQNLRGSTC